MNFRYAIFDMDGTFVDSMPYWRQIAANLFQEKTGIAPTGEERELLLSLPFSRGLAFLSETYGVSVSFPREEGLRMMDRYYQTEIKLKPHAREYLRFLRENGVTLCVVTATPGETARRYLERQSLLDWFAFVLSTHEFGAGKNEPAIFRHAQERLGAPMDQTVVFEDAYYSMKTAKELGYRVAAVEDETAIADKTAIVELCDFYIRDFSRLLPAGRALPEE